MKNCKLDYLKKNSLIEMRLKKLKKSKIGFKWNSYIVLIRRKFVHFSLLKKTKNDRAVIIYIKKLSSNIMQKKIEISC